MNMYFFEPFEENKPPKKEPLKGNYSEILLQDLKKKIGTLENFKFLDIIDIAKLIKMNYRYVNAETLSFAVLKIKIQELDNEIDGDISRFKPEEQRINFVEIVIHALTEETSGHQS